MTTSPDSFSWLAELPAPCQSQPSENSILKKASWPCHRTLIQPPKKRKPDSSEWLYHPEVFLGSVRSAMALMGPERRTFPHIGDVTINFQHGAVIIPPARPNLSRPSTHQPLTRHSCSPSAAERQPPALSDSR